MMRARRRLRNPISCQNFPLWESRQEKILFYLVSDMGEHPAKIHHPQIPDLVADGIPQRVVPVLFPAPCIYSDYLQMPIFVGADPYIFPGRGDHQLPDTLQQTLVGNALIAPVVMEDFTARLPVGNLVTIKAREVKADSFAGRIFRQLKEGSFDE